MSITEVKDQFISAQWGSFLEESIIHLDQAREIYVMNKSEENGRSGSGRRKAIAIAENIPASVSITLAVTALEGATNTAAYWKKIAEFNQWLFLTKRIKSFVSLANNLEQAVVEISVVRDCIIHGWIWQKSRRFAEDYTTKFIKSYLWKPFKANQRKKFDNFVNLPKRSTSQFSFSIIPIDVNFIDGLMTLLVVEKILEIFGYKDKVLRLYTAKNCGFSKQTAEIPADNNFCTLEDWIKYFAKELEANDKKTFDFLNNKL